MGQRRGYLGIQELQDAGAAERKLIEKKNLKKKKSDKSKKKKKEENKRSISLDARAFEKKHKDSPKGTSFYWKATIELLSGFVVYIYLTCIVDSKFC